MKAVVTSLCALLLVFGAVGSAGAMSFEGHDYVVVQLAGESWTSATSHMLSTLGPDYHLATITSQDEQDFIQFDLLEAGGYEGEYWLGGEQIPNTEPNSGASWWWVNDEGKFWDNGLVDGMFENWADGEPNDAGGDGNEQYLAMWSNFQWGWNDEGYLDNITGYIAESRSVPEPATIILLTCGFVGLIGFGRKKFFKK